MKIKVFTTLLCCMFLTSCNLNIEDFSKPKAYDPREIASDDHPFAVETMEEIIRCLDEDDSEALKKLLSQEVLNRTETDDEIEEIMKTYDGKSFSHDNIRNGISSSSAHEGKYKQKSIYITAENLVTDTDFICNIDAYYTLVDENDPSKIGIKTICIFDKELNPICAINFGKEI